MYNQLLKKYATSEELLEVLVRHSGQVAEMAVAIARRHPELGADEEFVREAAMLHDIGIVRCNAPAIHCFGDEPYIRHGLIGSEILIAEGLPRHARVAERHTGTGITVEGIREQNLPLPLRDYSPETIEEQIICYADKFFSKTKLGQTKTAEQALASLWKFGDESARRFNHWHEMFA
ncbi:MAG: HDIG domain-containing protein [Bacteroidaceae bacterium]|nr:HDIG domain-containing protein [Bacteroidaceae bacterium]